MVAADLPGYLDSPSERLPPAQSPPTRPLLSYLVLKRFLLDKMAALKSAGMYPAVVVRDGSAVVAAAVIACDKRRLGS